MGRTNTSLYFKPNHFIPIIIRKDKTKQCQPFESVLQSTKQKLIQFLPNKYEVSQSETISVPVVSVSLPFKNKAGTKHRSTTVFDFMKPVKKKNLQSLQLLLQAFHLLRHQLQLQL